MKMINAGFGNMIPADRVVAITMPDIAQTKRAIARAKEEGKILDASQGRRTRSVIVMNSGHVILSSLIPFTFGERISKNTVQNTVNETADEKSR